MLGKVNNAHLHILQRGDCRVDATESERQSFLDSVHVFKKPHGRHAPLVPAVLDMWDDGSELEGPVMYNRPNQGASGYCASCGASRMPKAKFCSECGKPLDEQAPSQHRYGFGCVRTALPSLVQ